MATHVSHACLPFPVKGARYTVWIGSLDADGDPTDLSSPDSERSIDGAAFADCTEEATVITGSNGSAFLTLTGDEMNCALLSLAIKGTGPKATIAGITPRVLPVLESGTAQAGAGTTITLAAGAPAYDLRGCIVRTTGGTGGGGGSGAAGNQARTIISYNPSTRVATVGTAWETNPDATTTYDILITDLAGVALAANATAISGDAAAADSFETMLDGTGGSVLSLRQLNIVNSTGDALVASSTGGNGKGINATGNGSGAGILATGGATGMGLSAIGNGAGGHGLNVQGLGAAAGIMARGGGANGPAIYALGAGTGAGLAAYGGADGAGLDAWGGGTQPGLLARSEGTGAGLLAQGGLTGGDGARFEARVTNFDGLELATAATPGTGLPLNPPASGGGGGPTAGDIADAVWEEILAPDHTDTGSAGAALIGAGSAGDPWSTPLPGAYGSGSAGNILGNNLNAAVSSRAPETGGNVAAIKAKTDNLPASPAATGAAMTLAAGAIGTGSFAAGAINAAAIGADAITAAKIAQNAIDADALHPDVTTELQSGLATAANLTLVKNDTAAIKAKTDNLPAQPAAAGDPMTLTTGERDAIADAHFARALPGVPAAGSAGEALTAAWAQGYGKWSISGDTLTLFKPDGLSVLRSFQLSPSGGPFTTRTPA